MTVKGADRRRADAGGPGARDGGPRRRTAGRRHALAVVVAGLGLCAGAPRARAHPEFSALGTNRYVTVAVFDGRVDVSDVWLEGLLVCADDRRRFDADADGRIDDAEVAAAERRMVAEGPAVTVELDGRTLTAPLDVAVDLGGEPRATSAPIAVERRLSFGGVISPGAHSLRVSLAREAPHPLDTELAVVLGPGLALGAGPDRVTFRGPRVSTLEDRAAVFELTAPRPAGARWAAAAAVAAAAMLGAVGWTLSRRRRRRSARG